MPAAEDAKAECHPTSTNGRGWVTRSERWRQTPATERKAAPRRSAEARGAFSTAAGRRARLRARGQREAEHPRTSQAHPEWVGRKAPSGGAWMLRTRCRLVCPAEGGERTCSQRLGREAATLTLGEKRADADAAKGRGGIGAPPKVRKGGGFTYEARGSCALREGAGLQGGGTAAAGWRARLRGWGLWEAKHPRAGKGHPEWVGGMPPAAVRGCRWLGGCRGCVVPRRPTMSAAGWRAWPRGWGHAGRQRWGALQGQGGGAGHHKAIICKSYVKLLAIYEA